MNRWVGVGVALMVAVVLGTAGAVAQVAPPLPDGTALCDTAQPSPAAKKPKPDDPALRVATFNVLHSETEEGDSSLGARLPLLADAIADADADVVGAQEVTRNATFDAAAEAPQRHGLVAQRLAAALADRTGVPWEWCWSLSNPHVPGTPDLDTGGGNPLDALAAANGNFPDSGDFSEGLAILTRHHVANARFRRLPIRSYEAPACALNPEVDPLCALDATFDSRQVLFARIEAPAGPFDMFTTHLAHHLTALSDTTKLLQMQEALAITEEWATPDATADFLVGDFNSDPASDRLAAASAAGFVDTYRASGGADCDGHGSRACTGNPPAGQEVHTMSPKRAMESRIDYVLARPPQSCTLVVPDSHPIGDEAAAIGQHTWLWPSDHVGFVSEVASAAAASSAVRTAGASAPAEGSLPVTGTERVRWAWLAAALVLGNALAVRRVIGQHG